jgi:hypothetical protein
MWRMSTPQALIFITVVALLVLLWWAAGCQIQ